MITGILFVQAVAFAVLSAIIASNKNRDPFGWGAIGFFFGLFGFVAAIAVGEPEPDEESTSEGKKSQPSSSLEFNPDDHEKKCPDCAEYIKLETSVCRYCGHEFSEDKVRSELKNKKKEFEDREEKDLYKTDEYDTEEILSTHDFKSPGICKKCDHTKPYIRAENYICPES